MTVRRYTKISSFEDAREFIEYCTQPEHVTKDELREHAALRLKKYREGDRAVSLELAVGASYVLLILNNIVR